MNGQMLSDVEALNAPDPKLVAARLIDDSGIDGPPLNLNRVIAQCDGLQVVEDNIDGDGYYVPLGATGAEILVKASSAETRKRFTIAHELGHWALARIVGSGSGESFQPTSVGPWRLEEWCNAFAASLLIPEPWLMNYLHECSGVELARRLAAGHQRFLVSPNAFRRAAATALRVDIYDFYALGEDRLADENYYLSRCTSGLAQKIVAEAGIYKALSKATDLRTVVRLSSVECSLLGIASETKSGRSGLAFWTTRSIRTDR